MSSSRPVFQVTEHNPQLGGYFSPVPPPPPRPTTAQSRETPTTSPLRRQDALHPPPLSTIVSTTQGGSTYSTPLSAIAGHSPFTTAASSPVVTTTAATAMASRTSGQFSVPYDPRDWAPGTDTRAAQARRVRENVAEDGLASPPPPYSPENPRSPKNGLERAQTMSAAQSPPESIGGFAQRRIFPVSNTPPSNRHSIHFGSYAPPPPPTAPPIPRTRVVSEMQNGQDATNPFIDSTSQAPSARRAASANAQPSRLPDIGSSRLTPQQRNWPRGMPLPGPPPGPPPGTSRSQSTSGLFDRQTGQVRARPVRQTIHVSDLGPVPPTPATWTADQELPRTGHAPLHIDTANVPNGSYTSPTNAATRNESGRSHATPASNTTSTEASSSVVSPPTNLTRSSAIRDSSVKGLRERRNRNSLILNGDFNVLSAQSNPWADSSQLGGNDARQDALLSGGPRSARLPPKANSPLAIVMNHDHLSASPVQLTSTPPMSPQPTPQQLHLVTRSAGLPSKTLPTPPPTQKAPLSAPSKTQPYREPIISPAEDYQDIFHRDAVQRHLDFLEKERLAISDIDRLQLFAEYVLREATIRQKRYESAFASGEFDVNRLRNSLFKISNDGRSASNSISQVSAEEPEPTTGNTTPQTRPETMWWKDYQPALSPIASMGPDEMSSRGRAPSRWWESQTGSQSGGTGGRPVHRSKRESKYMGLSKEFLMAHSPSDEYPNTLNPANLVLDASTYPVEKANPETLGYFDDNGSRPVSVIYSKKPETPALLDISRFITLPPPYPRHYPAVNNNHPELAQYRTTVRTLSELDEIKSRKAKHRAETETTRIDHKRRMSDSRRNFKNNVQAQFTDGRITYTEAAEAESAFKMSEYEADKQALKAEFDTLQVAVINPLHDMLYERLAQLDSSIHQLSQDLRTDARYQDPDQPQEEGDEKPELLEKLTQLKWLFDVREQIHRECFNLLTERNDKFKATVLFPHQYSRNLEKIKETEAFFDRDAHNRLLVYANEVLKRHETFLQTIEQHVTRGVQLQSSAFWDIAPGLLDLIQKIPEDLRHFAGIKIPDKEYKENPSYHQHPEQYLYSLLSHAEKSTYQYIEGQVNLHCLLHEVKTSLLGARYRALEAHEGRELSESKEQEEAALTAELKQRASMIEEQWLEALGSHLQATRGRVRALLQQDNAWEEIAEDDG